MPDFERWKLQGNPYVTSPIDKDSLDLFVGRGKQTKIASNIVGGKSIFVIEGNRGVGTTSFGNYLRFSQELKGSILTPTREISVGNGWNEEMLLANVLSSLTWELEDKITPKHKTKYNEIKAVAHQVRETYRNLSLQLSVLGTGGGISVNKQTSVTMPQLIPSTTLIQHLVEIKRLIDVLGYRQETIIQLNNLDIDILFSSGQLAFFLNNIRDILQIDGYTWILVGDSGLRNFIADKVDRLDDIISYDCTIEPLSLKEVLSAINARIQKFALNDKPIQPINNDLIQILYHATNGRIRQIFGFATRLIHSISDNLLIEQITPEIGLPIIKREVQDRLRQNNITKRERLVLEEIATQSGISPSILSKITGLSPPNLSRILTHLLESRCVTVTKEGRVRKYTVTPDVHIAFKKPPNLAESF